MSKGGCGVEDRSLDASGSMKAAAAASQQSLNVVFHITDRIKYLQMESSCCCRAFDREMKLCDLFVTKIMSSSVFLLLCDFLKGQK